MDEPDWVTWRWTVGTVVAVTLVGLWWWFEVPDLAWLPLPFLVVLAVPRVRTEPGQPISLPSLAFQHLPALALAVLLVRALRAGEGVPDALLLTILAVLLVVGVVHGLWLGRHHPDGAVAGLALVLGAWCCVLAVSGVLQVVEEPEIVTGLLLVVAGDLVSTLSRTWREDPWLLPSVVFTVALAGAGALTLSIGEAPVVGAVLLTTAIVCLPVLWTVKRRGRRDDRIRRIWRT